MQTARSLPYTGVSAIGILCWVEGFLCQSVLGVYI